MVQNNRYHSIRPFSVGVMKNDIISKFGTNSWRIQQKNRLCSSLQIAWNCLHKSSPADESWVIVSVTREQHKEENKRFKKPPPEGTCLHINKVSIRKKKKMHTQTYLYLLITKGTLAYCLNYSIY